MENIRRINIFGAPCAGKSSVACELFYYFKMLGYNTELVREYIKSWVYSGKKPQSFDQNYLFAKQLYAEDSLLYNGIGLVITDSPLLLSAYYAKKTNCSFIRDLIGLSLKFEEKYPSYNILLSNPLEYSSEGIWHDKEQSQKIHNEIKIFLGDFVHLTYHEYQINEVHKLKQDLTVSFANTCDKFSYHRAMIEDVLEKEKNNG